MATRADDKITMSLKSCQKKLNDFYQISETDLPEIIYLNSRKEIDECWGKKTEAWLSAWVKNNKIHILSPANYANESSHKNIKHFWQTLHHEYAHLYFKKITGTNKPKWLNEGLACFLAGQIKKNPPTDSMMRVFDYFEHADKEIYVLGYFWTKLLLDNFGKEKMLRLIRSLRKNITEKQFARQFKKIYQIPYSLVSFSGLVK